MIIFDPYNEKKTRIMYEFKPSAKLIILFSRLHTQNNNLNEEIEDYIEEMIRCYKRIDNNIKNNNKKKKYNFSLTKFFLPEI